MPMVRVNGATLAYSDTGPPPGRPEADTLVFGHGLLFGGWMFGPQIAALREDYRCVTLDWRGQGATPACRHGYDMDTLTGDALSLIERLHIAPVHFVGLSMGGFVGQRIAARHEGLLRSLTLLGSSADAEEPRHAREYKKLAAVYRLVGPTARLMSRVLPLMFGPASLAAPEHEPLREELTERLRACDRVGTRRAVLGVANRSPVHEELARITVPTLVAVGADDAATPPARSQRIAAAISGARLETLPDCGHSSTLEQPGAVNALLRDFLAG
ncbi:alpha/beta hydrolase [Streptomyces sp. N2-109]|uniref:Alpha/beta hydrolase n=1 Tax=Streptomyces gossypii TaxID=2883101 RepID=A0ABT2K2H5_9ACTN|nr:alpha/beta hydrolase [Streptomyces gossypii]MCT2594353.1 alpha/beta hydrolase [Streptomyces gossypii]